ncbi:hypothetical protein IWX49DRAFT_627286 [Phyllosticta citricarpa]
MPPQCPAMSASIRGFSLEGFVREPIKSSRQNAPSFSNGLLRANKLVAVVFPRHANKMIMCHADILRFWSPKLRALVDDSILGLQGIMQTHIQDDTVPKLAFDSPLNNVAISSIALRDVQPQIFAIFLDWAYSAKLPATKPLLNIPAPADTDESESNASFYYRQPEAKFLEAYIFGRRYHIRDFRNDTFDCLFEIVDRRKVGKEGDPTGSLMPSLLVCQRAMEALGAYDHDPVAWFLSGLFHYCLPNAIQSTREEACATELEENWDIPIRNESKGDEVRDGPGFLECVTKEREAYCERHHEHLGDEKAHCWARPKPDNDSLNEEEDAGSAIDEEKEDEKTEDGADGSMDDGDSEGDTIDGGDIEDDADDDMDEDEEVEESEDEELPDIKSFGIWGSDESNSEDWDEDYEYGSSVQGSEEFEEDDEEEEEEGEIVPRLKPPIPMPMPELDDYRVGGANTVSAAERYHYAW